MCVWGGGGVVMAGVGVGAAACSSATPAPTPESHVTKHCTCSIVLNVKLINPHHLTHIFKKERKKRGRRTHKYFD